MSLTTPAGMRALDVPATPSSSVGTASLARAPEVLVQAPLGTQKKAVDRLALFAAGSPALVRQFYAQVHGWPASAVVQVSSWSDIKAQLASCSSIGELAILSHAAYSAVSVGGAQRTAGQFCDEVASVAPSIGSLAFDGCVFGTDLPGLHTIATRLRIPRVYGWTFWHYMDWWNPFPATGDPAADLAVFQPLGQAASPWLPKSVNGQQVYTLAEQEPLFSARKLNVAAEYFVESLTMMADPSFLLALQDGRLDPATHRPRGSAEFRLIDSSGAQGAADAAINASRPMFGRIEMTPW
ncbi:MAG: hypothetical protein IT361_15310 [Gemmatimonadaceae bacterium]|nr:hypothetical protein [Gemmatimonadaceae bacterium]